MNDILNATESTSAGLIANNTHGENMEIKGRFHAECVGADGTVKWTEDFDNLVTTAGKNLALDTILAGSGYTVTGPYLGLISSVGYSAVNAADTMASHAGWAEAGNGTNYPVWTTPASNARGTPSWSAASSGSKATSSAVSFTIGATGGTIKGCFLVFGTGAVTTNNNTSGTLLSAGTFSGGDRVVITSDVVNVSYTLSL